jgi:CheY-like chemotaxis protein
MIFGAAIDERLSASKNPTQITLEAIIRLKRPHLILLDLRLKDELGDKKLEDLGGYKILKYIKSKSSLKGLPVIMFTASTSADNVKKLSAAGAEYVWTKPGIDEALSPEEVVARYEQLIAAIRTAFTKFEGNINLESRSDVEASRTAIFQKLEYIQYRALLNESIVPSLDFNKFSDIFIDTNVMEQNAKSICNVFKLSQLCSKSAHSITIAADKHVLLQPRIIFHNRVIDEIVRHSKKGKSRKPFFWKMALIAYDVLQNLFQSGQIRTEYNSLEGQPPKPSGRLLSVEPKPADPFLVDEIIRIASGRWFKIGGKKSRYTTRNVKILLVTNDKGLTSLVLEEFDKLTSSIGSVDVIDTDDFNRLIDAIPL